MADFFCSGRERGVAVACRSGTGALLMPCGRCRQVLYEFGGPDCLLDTPRGVLPLDGLDDRGVPSVASITA